MPNYTLTILDTASIQDYIFGTNNLKQNAGASYLAACATRAWVKETLEAVAPRAHNVVDLDDVEEPFNEKVITDANVLAEVIYAGGGNTAILFNNLPLAQRFTGILTRRVLLEAPGLHLAAAHQEFDWNNTALGGKSGIVFHIMQKLKIAKQEQPPSYPLRGLGVTVDCAFTNRPAVGYEQLGQQDRPLSAESWAKRRQEKAAEQHLLKVLQNPGAWEKYSIPRDFENIGSTHGESSYIAVVHVDGNQMGHRIEALRDQYQEARQNRDYIGAMRAFSLSVQKAANQALQATVAFLIANIKEEVDTGGDRQFTIGDQVVLQFDKEKTQKPFLPFRPLVFGGDDVTFVCEGRLGLQLTAVYLQRFSAATLHDGQKAHCRAGVAVVHSHYPFALAYELAETLCRSAKKAIRTWVEDPMHAEDGITALDWHFAVNGMNLALAETRQRDYTSVAGVGNPTRKGDLLMRPLRINEPEIDWRSWEQFTAILRAFQQQEWQERRNKLIGLREPLRRGPQAVTQYRLATELQELPPIRERRTMAREGWQGNECGYFDAIEALDFFLELQGAFVTNGSEAA